MSDNDHRAMTAKKANPDSLLTQRTSGINDQLSKLMESIIHLRGKLTEYSHVEEQTPESMCEGISKSLSTISPVENSHIEIIDKVISLQAIVMDTIEHLDI